MDKYLLMCSLVYIQHLDPNFSPLCYCSIGKKTCPESLLVVTGDGLRPKALSRDEVFCMFCGQKLKSDGRGTLKKYLIILM